MPYLDITLAEPSVTYGIGKSLNPGWCIVYTTGLRGWRDHVELETGGDLAKLTGRAFIRVGEAKPEVVGMLHHLPESPGDAARLIEHYDESYSVEFAMTEDQVMALIEAERLGRGPTGVKIEVEKLAYGWAPDGSETKWNNAEERSLPVRSASFFFGSEPMPHDDDEDVAPLPVIDPTVTAIEAVHRDLRSKLTLIAGLLALIAVIVIAKG